jgi:two-component system cell cycle sensor histidine kinase/response regulator CckA
MARTLKPEEMGGAREAPGEARESEAICAVAAGVAHDLNNLLSIVLAYAAVVFEGLEAGDPLRADVSQILAVGERAARLTSQLLALGSRASLAPRVVDANAIALGMERMLRHALGRGMQLTVLAAPDLDRVRVDPGQLERMFLNLVLNARDAMPTGGQVTIETANVDLDDESVTQWPEVTPGRYVLIAVSDTGVGMDAATRERVFEPFFTTKDPGKGTGLGLFVVASFVRRSSGHLHVQSAPGKGARFEVYFPRTDGE